MAENTKIEWCDATFNPWVGCSKVSPACQHCYAEAWAKRSGMVKWGNDAERRRTSEANWRKPLKWDNDAKKAGERRRVFCASLADVFEDREELAPWRDELFQLIDRTPNLDWLLLTKRPENIKRLWPWGWYDDQFSWPNVWIGTTVENQEWADRRIPELLRIPAAVHFLSIEPMLGPIDLRLTVEFIGGYVGVKDIARDLWVIVGGESGPRARTMAPSWARDLRDQCRTAGVPFFFKQWSGLRPGGARLLDGVEHSAFPEVAP